MYYLYSLTLFVLTLGQLLESNQPQEPWNSVNGLITVNSVGPDEGCVLNFLPIKDGQVGERWNAWYVPGEIHFGESMLQKLIDSNSDSIMVRLIGFTQSSGQDWRCSEFIPYYTFYVGKDFLKSEYFILNIESFCFPHIDVDPIVLSRMSDTAHAFRLRLTINSGRNLTVLDKVVFNEI